MSEDKPSVTVIDVVSLDHSERGVVALCDVISEAMAEQKITLSDGINICTNLLIRAVLCPDLTDSRRMELMDAIKAIPDAVAIAVRIAFEAATRRQ